MQGRSPVLFGASEGVRLLRILAAPIHFVYKLLILWAERVRESRDPCWFCGEVADSKG